MALTLRDLKDDAAAKLAAGQPIDALRIYHLILLNMPLDFQLRLQIGDVLVGLGKNDAAQTVFNAVAKHNIRSGEPLQAMVALKRSAALGATADAIVADLVRMYASESGTVGRGLRPAPVDDSIDIPEGAAIAAEMPENTLISETTQTASRIENIVDYPKTVPPIPILSTVTSQAFARLFEKLTLKQFVPGDFVIRQGEPGQEIYFLARGTVDVVCKGGDPAPDEDLVHLARLGPGSLFGEMALVSTDPRSASVICETPVDALQLKRADIEVLSEKLPTVAAAMKRFTRERMIHNLFATNPLFKPFNAESQKKLLAQFTGHEIPKNTIYLEQGQPGKGLYIILQGRAEVLKWEDEAYTRVADLGPGDVSGEISLLYEEPISATVRTTTPATVLFLARELFTPIVNAFPELLAYYNRLAESRLADTEFKLMQRKVVDDDFIESIEDSDEQLDDDIIFI
ncbi:MAG: cyclic nucleotide-binding domain-containing protein [Myxococcota bacterium]|nr:cyclic nucleotide-binding domain-containing protein [Myxococcota bacterium]